MEPFAKFRRRGIIEPAIRVVLLAVTAALAALLMAGAERATAAGQRAVEGSSALFRVTLLGTGNPRPALWRFGPSTLVEAGSQKFVFDCGRGTTLRLYQLKVPFTDVNALFLTHLHSDHTVGIPDLWLTGWVMGRKVPLQVWGPKGTSEMMGHLEETYAFDVHIRRDVDEQLPAEGAQIQAHDIGQGLVYEGMA